MKLRLQILILAALCGSSTGCALTESANSAWRQTKRIFTPRPFDDPQPTGTEDDWGFVGSEARADLPRERDPDRWWQNLVMSEKARHIERNLGID